MPDIGKLLNWDGKATCLIDDFPRAEGVEFMIGHRGVSLILVRSTGPLAAQTVLLMPAGRTRLEVEGEAGEMSKASMAVIGVRNHPTLPDLDIRRGDRFAYDGHQYEVTHVDTTMAGKTEARADKVS